MLSRLSNKDTREQGKNPMHSYLETSPMLFSQDYSQENDFRIAAVI